MPSNAGVLKSSGFETYVGTKVEGHRIVDTHGARLSFVCSEQPKMVLFTHDPELPRCPVCRMLSPLKNNRLYL